MSATTGAGTWSPARARSATLPRISTTLTVSGMLAVAFAPSLLPRGPVTQAVLTGTLAAIGFAVAALCRLIFRRIPVPAVAETIRPIVVGSAAIGVLWMIVESNRWQNSLRAAMGSSPTDVRYWLQVVAGSALVFLAYYAISWAVRWFARRIGLPGIGALAVATALVVPTQTIPALVHHQTDGYASSNAVMEAAVRQPISSTRSGGVESLTPWDTLGVEGRRFVTVGTDTASVRTYVGLDSAPDPNSRAALAVRELERAGGFDKRNIVVAIPTGSGWIDANAVTGFEERFRDDVALVGMQYSKAPSWATFVFGRSAAEESARALFTAVSNRLAQIPAAHRPRLYVYGQSLGSVGGAAIFDGKDDLLSRTCGALWAGPPAGAVDRAGATVLANSSDPVVRWSPSLLWHAPRLDDTQLDAPEPQWIPVVSFVQTTVDLLGALNAPAGHGHRYGTEQGTAMQSRC